MEQQSIEKQQTTCSSGTQPSAPGLASRAEQRAIRLGIRELVTDIDGTQWEVTESRRTKHGFKLLLGLPLLRRDLMTGGRQLIVTHELAAYCYQHRIIRGAQFALPISVATIHRLRLRLGLNFSRDVHSAWEADAPELKTLSLTELANRHHVSNTTAQRWRKKIQIPRAQQFTSQNKAA